MKTPMIRLLWKGFDVKEEKTSQGAGFGGSTNIVEVGGTYTGEDDNVFTFRVLRSGMIPSEEVCLLAGAIKTVEKVKYR